jgi:hypothetical protein
MALGIQLGTHQGCTTPPLRHHPHQTLVVAVYSMGASAPSAEMLVHRSLGKEDANGVNGARGRVRVRVGPVVVVVVVVGMVVGGRVGGQGG